MKVHVYFVGGPVEIVSDLRQLRFQKRTIHILNMMMSLKMSLVGRSLFGTILLIVSSLLVFSGFLFFVGERIERGFGRIQNDCKYLAGNEIEFVVPHEVYCRDSQEICYETPPPPPIVDPPPPVDRDEYEECSQPSDCKYGLDCIHGLCAVDGLKIGHYCKKGDTCLSGHCSRNRCEAQPVRRFEVDVPVFYDDRYKSNSDRGKPFVELLNSMVKKSKFAKYSIFPRFVGTSQVTDFSDSPAFVYFQECVRGDIDFFVNIEDHKTEKLDNILLPAYKSREKIFIVCGRHTKEHNCLNKDEINMNNRIRTYREANHFDGLYEEDLLEVNFLSGVGMTEECHSLNSKNKKILGLLDSVLIHLSSYHSPEEETEKLRKSRESTRNCLEQEVENCGRRRGCESYISKCIEKVPTVVDTITTRRIGKFDVCSSRTDCKVRGTACENIYRKNRKLEKEKIYVCVPDGHFKDSFVTTTTTTTTTTKKKKNNKEDVKVKGRPVEDVRGTYSQEKSANHVVWYIAEAWVLVILFGVVLFVCNRVSLRLFGTVNDSGEKEKEKDEKVKKEKERGEQERQRKREEEEEEERRGKEEKEKEKGLKEEDGKKND